MADKQKPPTTANEVLASVHDDHDWAHQPEDLTSTGGIQRSVKRNAAAIQALADFIDGKFKQDAKPDPVKEPAKPFAPAM